VVTTLFTLHQITTALFSGEHTRDYSHSRSDWIRTVWFTQSLYSILYHSFHLHKDMQFSTNYALKAVSVLTLAANVDAFWRMPCKGRTGLARIDPLVDYGVVSEHVHAIHGSNGKFHARTMRLGQAM
jgi:hypothetical protein